MGQENGIFHLRKRGRLRHLTFCGVSGTGSDIPWTGKARPQEREGDIP